MNHVSLLLSCVFLISVCAESEADLVAEAADSSLDVVAETARAQAAITLSATALKSELSQAIKEGGAQHAIAVCHTKAITITEKAAKGQALQLSRVSLRNRNPVNTANDWQKPVLEWFEERVTAGEDPNKIDWSELAETADGAQEFRYMKAIPTAPVCVQCHGQNIAPDVSAQLDQLYPEDKAVGFAPGDIRGAFVVTRIVSE